MGFMSLAAGFIGYTTPLLITIHMVMPECSAYMLVQIHPVYVYYLYFTFHAHGVLNLFFVVTLLIHPLFPSIVYCAEAAIKNKTVHKSNIDTFHFCLTKQFFLNYSAFCGLSNL